MASFKLFTLLCLLYVRSIKSNVVPGSGTFRITGIFPITSHDRSTINFQAGIMMQEAMNYAINKINKLNNSNYLFGYQLESFKVPIGTDENQETIYSDGNHPNEISVREGILQSFLNDIPFIIGPYSSGLAYVSSILTGTFQLISLSYGAGYSKFQDFGPRNGWMLRTIPSDSYRISAVLELLKKLEWNYVALVSSNGYDGEREAKEFVHYLAKIGVCVADSYDINNIGERKTNYAEIVKKLTNDKRLKAVIMFTTNEDSKGLIKHINQNNDGRKFLLLCVYGCTNYIEVVNGAEENTAGVLSVNLKPPELPDFQKYFLQLKPSRTTTKYFNHSWQEMFQCSLRTDETKCLENQFEVGKGYYPNTPVHTVINAVSVIAEALHILIELLCTPDRTWMFGQSRCVIVPEQPQKYINNLYQIMAGNTFRDGTLFMSPLLLPIDTESLKVISYDINHYLNINGSYENVLVANWKYTRGDQDGAFEFVPDHKWRLNNGSYGKEEALCSATCPIGYIPEPDVNPQLEKCCWNCVQCPRNNVVQNKTCVACLNTETVNLGMDECIPLPKMVIELKNNPAPAFITMMSIVGLCFIVVVIAFFVKYNNYRLVRASGRDLCYMILFGLSLMFGLPFFFLGNPSVSTCLLRSGLPGVAFLSVYAPLFLKTNRIYRIFCHAKRSVSRPSLVSSRSLLLLSFGIVVVQVLLVGVWFISKVPIPEEKVSKDMSYVTVHCRGDSSPILLLLNVALSVGFMISCTFLAFKTRHFPKNYNEAKVIGITLYVTCVAWAIFLPVYFLIPETNFVREYFMSAICIVIGYITLFGLFGQKIWLLMCQKNLDNGNGNLPTWYLSYSDCKENGDAMMTRPDEKGSSDETIA